VKQVQVYVLDLTKIGGRGDFLCPRCGNVISPDDCSEKAYSIHLTGFSLLQELGASFYPFKGDRK
jgi:hypothetical protein